MRRVALVVTMALGMACAPTSSRAPTPPRNPTPPQNATASREPPRDTGPGADGPGVASPSPSPAGPLGNTRIATFEAAKKELSRIYEEERTFVDLYCGCPFEPASAHGFRVDLAACGYSPSRDPTRAARIEWEHAVPAAAFGRTFSPWRDGDDACVDGRGKRYRGRKCARKASREFSRMEADLHNLFPVVGEVNALREDLPMGVLDLPSRPSKATYRFGRCTTEIDHGVFLPRREVRGDLARAYKYMNLAYPGLGIVDDAHRALFDAWDDEDPPDAWERKRNSRIAERQGNGNVFIERERVHQ